MSGTDTTTAALIERVKAAKGPSYALDKAIWLRLDPPPHGHVATPPPITSELCEVEAFVERHLPGCYWIVAKGKVTPSEPMYAAHIWLDGHPISVFDEECPKPDAAEEHGTSAALAFLLAALMAIKTKEQRQ